MHGLVGYSEANHQNPIQTTLLFDRDNVAGYTYDFRNDNRLPLISLRQCRLSTIRHPGGSAQIRLRPQSSLNAFRTGDVELEWEATDALTLKAGPQWKKFEFKTTSLQRSNGTTTSQEGTIPALPMGTSPADYSKLTSLSSISLPAGSAGTWASPDVERANELFDLNNRALYPLGIETALNNNYLIEEEDTGGFVQANLNTTLGGLRFRGNLGVRYVKTDQESDRLHVRRRRAGARHGAAQVQRHAAFAEPLDGCHG